jgi:hypothetical protein
VLLVCAGLITLLVIIYKGHSPSLVRARSQKVLGVFLQVLCDTPVRPVRRTGLTGVSCEVQCLIGLTGGALSTQVFGGESLIWSSRLFTPL